MELGQYLILSTAHLRCATAETIESWARLPATDQPLAVASTQYGWFLSTREPANRSPDEMPDELPHILAFARAAGCAYVLFDCDGPEEPALPVFPW